MDKPLLAEKCYSCYYDPMLLDYDCYNCDNASNWRDPDDFCANCGDDHGNIVVEYCTVCGGCENCCTCNED